MSHQVNKPMLQALGDGHLGTWGKFAERNKRAIGNRKWILKSLTKKLKVRNLSLGANNADHS